MILNNFIILINNLFRFSISISETLYPHLHYYVLSLIYMDLSLKEIPRHVLNDLTNFIYQTYFNRLPNSLLISQAFIMKYPEYGKKFGLSEINKMIEDGIKRGNF